MAGIVSASTVSGDLLEYQSIPQGGWVMADAAGPAVWPGITRRGVAGYGRV